MLDRTAAQALVDGLSAVSLGAWTPALIRPRGASPLQSRLRFAFGMLCVFFAVRAAFEALAWTDLASAVLLIVCVLPTAGLLLAEGVLRRHAPAAVKILVPVGGCVTALALMASGGSPPFSNWLLGGYVILCLLVVAGLLIKRDRPSLSHQENGGVNALLYCGLLLTVLSVSDFLPSAPIGLSGVGAALLAFVLTAGVGASAGRLWIEGLVMVCLSAVSSAVLSTALHLDAFGQTRVGAIFLALLIASGSLARAISRRRPGESESLADALAHADMTSLDSFLGGLTDEPLLAGLRIAEAGQLADYDTPALGDMMASGRPVWMRAALAGAEPTTSRPMEELADLMARTEATHAMMICARPLRIALLTLPEVSPAPEVQAQLALFGKLATLAAATTR